MCKGTIEEFTCLLGLTGEALCPWRSPETGFVKPYIRLWRTTAWECCGDHTSDCPDCPKTWDNLTTVHITSLECDECKARIRPGEELHREHRQEYLAYLDNRRRIAMPRLQAEIDAGLTNLTMEQLLWEDPNMDESVHVARVVWEAQLEEEIRHTIEEEQAAAAAAAQEEAQKADEAAAEKETDPEQTGEGSGAAQEPGKTGDVSWSDWLNDDDEEEK